MELACDVRVGPLEEGKDSQKVRERICKYIKRDIFFSGKKYGVKRRFIEDVEGEVVKIGTTVTPFLQIIFIRDKFNHQALW